MKLLIAVTSLVTVACADSAWARANCKPHPKEEWISEADAKTKLEAQGYRITKFKVDGNCYEIYGTDRMSKRVEIYFDTKTLSIVRQEVER
ncbi:MAG: PepSY domain-containing protein [Proteobacteria bacterium]|nr:PepSY domain-containing protein [Pseudomonadota bacterium]